MLSVIVLLGVAGWQGGQGSRGVLWLRKGVGVDSTGWGGPEGKV